MSRLVDVPSGSAPPRALSAGDVHELLERWRREGLLKAEDVARIEAAEAVRDRPPPPPERHGGSLIGEALGYAGGGLVLAATGVLLGRNWADLSYPAKLAIGAGATVLLLVAGAAVPGGRGGAAGRFRSVVWAGATVLAFATWTLVAGAPGFGWSARPTILFAAGLTLVQGSTLWWRSKRLPQQIVIFATVCVLVAAAAGYVPGVPDRAAGALAVFGVAVAAVALARMDVLKPRLAVSFGGSVVAVTAAQVTASWDWGAVFVLVVAAGCIAYATWERSLALLGVGTYAVLSGVPAAADRLFPGSTGIAICLLVAGGVLLSSGVWIGHTRPDEPERLPLEHVGGSAP